MILLPTIYLDKPQRNHTLMQTIARANRVYGDKNNGLNAGTIGVQDYFEQLFDFVGELNQEGNRANTEDLSEEELTVFDLLTRSEPDLTPAERDEVKTAVRRLLETLKREKFALDWRKRAQSRSQVRITIEEILGANDGLPGYYTLSLCMQKYEVVYQHIYDSYYGEGKSIYTQN